MEKYHLTHDSKDERDFIYESVKEIDKLPEEVDLRPLFPTKVFDQGKLGSCTANTLVGLREYLLVTNKQPHTDLSRLFLYYFERYTEGTVNQDSGAMLRDGMRVLQKMGVCPELDDEYKIQDFTKKPSNKAIKDALKFKISEYHRITTVDGVQHALAQGQPVAIGFIVFDSFESYDVAKTGIVPIPRLGEQRLGGHAVLVVGYKKINDKLHFIIRNSWGEDWGDEGYCYMPAEFFTNGIVVDMWTGK